ncbi:MAG TPA: zinc-binding alcohol dehydrogenase family protein, partial [Burkholderiaceae bacterium]|nr:zinc-binding alcohol dehydrogenase family protein [Burkholderiaceae bacterium]
MKAAQVDLVEGKPRLVVGQAPEPLPAPGELLVAVRAIGVNRADLLLRPDHFQSFPARERPPIPGIEAAGEVVGLGAGVDGFAIGDRVAGLTPGAYAERVAMPAGLAWRVPPALDWVQAASLPLAVCTAHDALTGSGRLQRGDAVAVLGATTSVGRIAIALARQLGAAEVVGT